jgi:4-hydroxy-4-methyl-2-oxoglutarate aldolase
VSAAGGHTTATLHEAAKLPCVLDPGIRPMWPGARVAGPAFTVRGLGGDNLALHHAVLSAPAGSVLVADLQGAEHGHWGEILAVAAQVRGIRGLVVDGGVRDSAELAGLGFPVFARSITVLGTVKRFTGDFGVPVHVGGITVHDGDLVVGDADGVVAIPAAVAAEVIARADRRVAAEKGILERIRAGASTVDIYGLQATVDP